MRNTVVSLADISKLYNIFRHDLPHAYTLFSIIVSKSHDQIEISPSLDTGRGQDSESDDSVNEIVDDKDKDGTDLS